MTGPMPNLTLSVRGTAMSEIYKTIIKEAKAEGIHYEKAAAIVLGKE